MRKTTRFLALALSAVVAAGSFAPTAEAASKTISRVGSKSVSVAVGKEFDLEVRKNGGIRDNDIQWSIGNTSIVRFDDDDRYDDEIELRAVKKGTTTVTAKNLITGGKIKYTVTVKNSSNTISRVGNASRSVTAGKEFELAVRKNGSFSDNNIKWTIGNTSIVRFDDNDRYDDEVELRAVQAGTTTVTANNLITGGKIKYTVTVKKPAGGIYISRVGSATKYMEDDDDIELRVSKGSGLNHSDIQWTIGNTRLLRFEDGRNYGAEVEVESRGVGRTTVTAHNLKTGGKIVYTINITPEYDD